MRRLHLADLDAAAQALASQPAEQRLAIAAMVMTRAQGADKYRKRYGVLHPMWGSGTLADAARSYAEPSHLTRSEDDYWAAMSMLLTAYLAVRKGPSDD